MTSNKPAPHIPSIIQFAVSGSSMLFLWGVALVYGLSGVIQLRQGSQPAGFGALFTTAIDIAVIGLLVFPSALFSFMRLINHPIETNIRKTPPIFLALILLWPVVLAAGNSLAQAGTWWAIAFFPVTQVAAVLILIAWFYLVAGYKLERSSSQRNWGILAAGMLGGTGLSLLIEIIGGILLFAGLIVIAMMNPAMQSELTQLANRMANAGKDMEAIMRILTPLVSRPAVIIPVVFSFSIAVPLIEEACKPIGLWFISRKGLTPAQGFMGGVISGAGFAVIESLLNTARLMDSSWILVSSMRFGTTLMHMLASGLVGWGLASAWSQRKYLRLAGAYLAAVVLHGVWNGLAVLSAVSQITQGQNTDFLNTAGQFALWGLGVWTLAALVVLLMMNSKLRARPAADPES